MNKKILIILLMMIAFVPNVLALGITPGRTTIAFEPSLEKTVSFSVVNSDKKDIDLVVFAEGELAKYISLSDVSLSLSASEESKTLSYTLSLPAELKPGLNTGEVVVLQLPEKAQGSDTFIGSTVGVKTQVYVHVPFPGKYAEAELNVIGPDNNGKVIFAMPVTSRGELDLVRVGATIDIFSSLNEKIQTITTNEVSLKSQERKEIIAEWNASDVQPGPYRIVVTLVYDESTLTLEKEFNVGKKILSLEGIEVNDFSLGEIAKFEILVENKWSESIENAYVQMLVYNTEGKVMADFKSQTYNVPALEKTLMVAFWDTEGVKKGTYDSSVFLRYGDSSEQKDLKLEINENEIKIIGAGYIISKGITKEGGLSRSLTITLITVIALLVIINLSWFIFLRKRFLNKVKR